MTIAVPPNFSENYWNCCQIQCYFTLVVADNGAFRISLIGRKEKKLSLPFRISLLGGIHCQLYENDLQPMVVYSLAHRLQLLVPIDVFVL